MTNVHELKTHPEFWWPIVRGEKTSEVRLNDRDYQVGDVLVLREWRLDEGFTGAACWRQISHVLHSHEGPWLTEGYVVLSFSSNLPCIWPSLSRADLEGSW